MSFHTPPQPRKPLRKRDSLLFAQSREELAELDAELGLFAGAQLARKLYLHKRPDDRLACPAQNWNGHRPEAANALEARIALLSWFDRAGRRRI